jgi:flagellin
MQIKNNQPAFNAWTNYTSNLSQMKKSMNRLSTGTITNTDDPAGIGISERMRSQIAALSMARQNSENGISLLQTADSWLQKVGDMTSRMKSLAIEAEGIMSSQDKSNVQTEFKAMQNEIMRITSFYTSAAKFNGLYLFRGGDGIATNSQDKVGTNTIKIQVGADVDQKISVDLKNLEVNNTAVIGTMHTYDYNSQHVLTASTHTDVHWNSIVNDQKMSVTMSTSNKLVGKIDLAIDFIAQARASMGAQQKRIENTRDGLMTYEDNLRSAESKIRDVDMAKESSEFAKYQILVNSGLSMLGQANQMPQAVLRLLG